jgi:hypothetical protein
METQSFREGYFDGFWIGPDKSMQFYLRTADQQSFALILEGVQALTLSGIKQGNIILDLIFRPTQEITQSDMEKLYGVGANTPQVMSLLRTATERKLQVLELSPSYGAQGLVLFQSWNLRQRDGQPSQDR